MTGKMHLTLGVANGLTISIMLAPDFRTGLMMTSLTAFAAVLPDIDIKNSVISKKVKVTSALLRTLFKHRSVTHTPIFGAGLCYLIWYFFKDLPNIELYLLSFGIGYLTHLLQDTMTRNGIRWLFPIYNKPLSLSKARSTSTIGYFHSAFIYAMITAVEIANFISL